MAKQWYDENVWLNILWMLSGILWLPIFLVFLIGKFDQPKWLRWWGNRVDNLVDQIKEWVHCHDIPYKNYHINISRWMKNRTTYGNLFRSRRDDAGNCWSNCDPEDCPEPDTEPRRM